GKREFLQRHAGLGDRAGDVVDRAGRRLGSHRGQHNFTVGQRRGLGIASADPLYVLATDAGSNRVIAGTRGELVTRRVRIRSARLHRGAERVNGVTFRYHAPRRSCRLELDPTAGEGTVALEESVDGVAPGQLACLMDGDLIVGHATIVHG